MTVYKEPLVLAVTFILAAIVMVFTVLTSGVDDSATVDGVSPRTIEIIETIVVDADEDEVIEEQ